MSYRWPSNLLLSILLFTCLAEEVVYAQNQNFKILSIEELKRHLRTQPADGKIEVLEELKDRRKSASPALPEVLAVCSEIMDSYPKSQIAWERYADFSSPLIPALRTIESIADENSPEAQITASYLVSICVYINGEAPFMGDLVAPLRDALISLGRSAIVPLAEALISEQHFFLSLSEILTIIANKMVEQNNIESLDDLQEAHEILLSKEYDGTMVGAMERDLRINLLPSAIEALQSLKLNNWIRSKLFKYIMVPITIFSIYFIINLLLILAAIKHRETRELLFNSNVTEKFLGRYNLVKYIILGSKKIRLDLFQEYRNNLKETLNTFFWKDKKYIPPKIKFNSDELGEGQVLDWEQCLKNILASSSGKIWFIKGPSGLGKSALLQQWCIKVIEDKELNPLLVNLGSGQIISNEIPSIIRDYGQINVNVNFAREIVKSGGFVLFLDALNEDIFQLETREFIRDVVSSNQLVLTSQYDPPWYRDKKFNIQNIQLLPFGKPELINLFSKEIVEEILENEYWKSIAELPYTAELLADYIQRTNKELPNFHIDLYTQMILSFEKKADNNGLVDHIPYLYQKAEELFLLNSKYFCHDDFITDRLCDYAIENKLLTRVTQKDGNAYEDRYSFSHELIQKFCIAQGLFERDSFNLTELHQKLKFNQPKIYWKSILEFFGEMKAKNVKVKNLDVQTYEKFLREVADFDLDIYKDLFKRAVQLDEKGLIRLSPAFIRWSAKTTVI